jgi:DNA-binding NarL/FixJ family response regulator
MRTFKIVLADDHPPMRQILKRILSESKEIEVVGEMADGMELLNFLSERAALPDMAILDVSMPKLQGIEATRRIKELFPAVKILILTVHKEREYVSQAFIAGAEGYLLKEEANTRLFTAIDTIRRGGIYKSPLLENSFN